MFKRFLKLMLISIPFIIGAVGYLNIPDITLSSALYHAIRLYSLNTDTNEMNILIEVARWTAPIVTMSVTLYFMNTLWFKIIYSFRARKKNSCTVYGENKEAAYFIESLGVNGIKGSIGRPMLSKYHVFFTKDMNEVLEIINNSAIKNLIDNSSKGYQFFFSVPSDVNIAFKHNDIHTFSIEENCSIKYWDSHMSKPFEKIAIIGSRELCDALLDKGLQSNIFDEHQQIEYHIWSDIKYDKTRLYLSEALALTEDKVFVYDGAWENHLHVIGQMNRIIVAYNHEDNLSIGVKLMNLYPNTTIHVKSDYDFALNELFVNQHIKCFGKLDEIINHDIIIKESLRDTGKKIHEHYQQYTEDKQAWEELSGFLIKSNISAAAFFAVIQKIALKYIDEKQDIPIDLLCKLEHIRWCRFYYLQNWKYGEEKSSEKQTHPLLIPFEKLDDNNKNKDKGNVELALFNIV